MSEPTRCVAIILPDSIDAVTFSSKIAPIIEWEMMDPQVRFILPERPIFPIRYLVTRKFRSCTIYLSEENRKTDQPSGDRPRVSRGLGYVEKFLSEEMIRVSLLADSDFTIGYSFDDNNGYIRAN